MKKGLEQFYFLICDVKESCGKKIWRIPLFIFSRSFSGICTYRFERALFLIFGKFYPGIKIIIYPILLLQYWYSNCEIHYKAKIGKGIKILHPGLGIVISGKAQIGDYLTMVGGNCIGITQKKTSNHFILGDKIEMGANSSIIGPLQLGNNIIIGANACVVKSYLEDNIVLIGVPALQLNGSSNN